MDTLPESLQAAIAPAYELERELAGGGMSRVFLATDQKLGRKVVVKVLPPDLSAGVNRDRFRREIQFAAQLLHPHIVQVISAGETDELLYYTMPFIEGESLRTQLERGELSSKRVVRILHDVVDALAYAHERGIVHRDIKPGNILTLGNHALVTDFGVAKAISAATPGSSSGVTSAGMAIGTPAYMAPEQLAADPQADHRVDIYAVGLLAYELLTGSSPFRQESPQATMAAQLTRTPVPLDVCCPGVSPELSQIVMRCIEKNPADRYPTAKALQAALDNVGVTASGSGTPVMTVPHASSGSRKGIVVAGAALLGAAAMYALFWNTRSEERVAAPVAPAASTTAAVIDTPTKPAAPPPVPAENRVTPVKPRGLSHEDSLAIARAMRDLPGRVTIGTGDAIARAAAAAASVLPTQRAATGAKPSVLIMFPRPTAMRNDLTNASRDFSERLRRAVESSGRFSLVPAEEMRRARIPQRDGRPAINSVKADVIVTMGFVGNEPKSLAVQLRDVRTGRSSSVLVLGALNGTASGLKDVDAGITETLAKLDALLKN